MGFFSARQQTRGRFWAVLASATEAGLPMDQALGTVAAGSESVALVPELTRDIARGRELSAAMAARPESFSDLETRIVEAGETAGRLPLAFSRLERLFEVRAAFRDRVGRGAIYPILLIHGSLLLPQLYRWVQSGLGDYLLAVLPPLLTLWALTALVVTWTRSQMASAGGRRRISQALESLPGARGALRQSALADFLFVLETLFSAGVPLPESVERAAAAASSESVRAAGLQVAARVRQGSGLADAFDEAASLVPPWVRQAIRVGESAGKLDENLVKAERAVRQDGDRALANLAMGLTVIIFLVAVVLAAWQILGMWRGHAEMLKIVT